MLLIEQAQAWFAPLVETSSPLLTEFQAFFTEFEETFGKTDKQWAALNKLYVLQQGERTTSIYAFEFRQLANGMDKPSLINSVEDYEVR